MSNMQTKIDSIRLDDGSLPYHAWPGLYPLFYMDKCGNVLCPTCANRNVDQAQEVIDVAINEENEYLYCNDCGSKIESAYGEDE